ncbi:PepSY-associated TM helix domain-containing protein [Pendulispora albinea]|uniref:PepSY domain-containing protein n=1 Tax=Pendulispora albinea TaxID=2741071 RepID=A0ABZ2M059_9BACT
MIASAIKTWFLIHKWTSLICTAFMLLLCVTGLPLIFHEEIDRALGYVATPKEMPGEAQRANVDDMVAASLARKPGHAVQFLFEDAAEPVWYVRLGETAAAEEPSAVYSFDARTGEYLNEYPLNQGLTNVLLRLHVDMFAGLKGTLFLGFMGLLLVASLVSGAVLYAPYMQKLHFGTVRRDRSPRLKWLDLHNLLGIATLVWFLVVGATGVINTLAIPVFGWWQTTELAEMTAPYRDKPPLESIGSPQKAIDSALEALPGTKLGFIACPGNPFAGPHHYVAFMKGTTPWTSKLAKPALIDARTSKVVETRSLPWYVSALLVSQPLHFGDYGGLPLKILWAVLDTLSIVVLGSGLYLWLRRRNVSFEAWVRTMQADKEDKEHEEPVVGAGKQATGA